MSLIFHLFTAKIYIATYDLCNKFFKNQILRKRFSEIEILAKFLKTTNQYEVPITGRSYEEGKK